MFKRYEHRGHVLLQFIPLRIYKFCLFQFSPRLLGSPNVHSTLRSMNREGFSRRSSTEGPGLEVIKLEFILRLKIKRNDWLFADTCPQAANHCALFWVWACTQVLQPRGLASIRWSQRSYLMPIDKGTHQGMLCISFRKYNSLKYNHARIQKVMSEAGGPITAQHWMLAW